MQTRVKGAELSAFERGMIVGSYKALQSERKVADLLKYSKSTVHKILHDFNNGLTKPASRSGRPKVTSVQGDRIIRRVARKNRRCSLAEIREEVNKSIPVTLSLRTVQRRLHAFGIYSHSARKVPLISSTNRRARVFWAKEHLTWPLDRWKQILWSDESRFTIFQADGRLNVWREAHERYQPACMQHIDRRGSGIMVWGCFSWYGLGPLIVCHGSVNTSTYSDILEKHVYPTLLVMFGDVDEVLFQDDNAPPHRSKQTINIRESLGIHTIQWPSQSPDLNPIENLWSVLERRLRHRSDPPHTATELEHALQCEWTEMAKQPQMFRNYIESMPKRLQLVKKHLGYATKF
jgi:transposase